MLIVPQNSPENAVSPSALAQRIASVQRDVAAAAAAAGRNVDSVTLLAVSKGQSSEVIREAASLGLRQFGENYIAEALPKITALAELDLTWHFIGRLQANKTRDIATFFQWVHGVDRLRIAQRLSEQRSAHAPPLNVCLQVNIAAEAGKGGVAPSQVDELAQAVAALPRLKLRGLMCMLPFGLAGPEAQRTLFERMRALLASPVARALQLDTLSMGMSADFVPAIAAGASIVRIGTALFGPRVRTVE